MGLFQFRETVHVSFAIESQQDILTFRYLDLLRLVAAVKEDDERFGGIDTFEVVDAIDDERLVLGRHEPHAL